VRLCELGLELSRKPRILERFSVLNLFRSVILNVPASMVSLSFLHLRDQLRYPCLRGMGIVDVFVLVGELGSF
jgi:hypothetical protein